MPSLRIHRPGANPTLYRLYKRLTSIGRGEENDLALPDPGLADAHAHILCNGSEFEITLLAPKGELCINGKRRKKHRLTHEDQILVGRSELTFLLYDDPAAVGSDDETQRSLAMLQGYHRLFEFSERLSGQYVIAELLGELMDAVIALTRADKGFLVLLEEGALHIKVARNLHREDLADALEQLSDSIVDKVVKSREAVIVSDALHDAEFKSAMSVLNLKLSSVMCVPLLDRGNLIGVIYVGNDSVAHLFEASSLEVLKIFAAQAALLLRNALLVSELQTDNRELVAEVEALRFGDLIGSCPTMQEVFRKVAKIASTDISVLITGETGTGKELIAREIHRRSPRARGPFVAINCGAIPENLLESELFGHTKGAFTGAVAPHAGKFQAAHEGTLFLDEIGEMPQPLQVKILRALQERAVVRVGDHRPESVDIRVVAATHRQLDHEIKAGRFREDLYYRLNVINLHLPPLRERGEDVVLLARYLLQRFIEEFRSPVRGFSPPALTALVRFAWPGNIRQLENHLKKAVVLSDRPLLSPEDLGLSTEILPAILPLAEAKEKFQRDYINEVLDLNRGNRTKAARDLGVDPRTIFRHLEKEDGGPDEPL